MPWTKLNSGFVEFTLEQLFLYLNLTRFRTLDLQSFKAYLRETLRHEGSVKVWINPKVLRYNVDGQIDAL
jgi:hypothetical protein